MKVLYKLYDAFSGFRLQIALHFFNLYSARMLLHFFYFAHLAVEYFEIVDDEHLQTVKSWSEDCVKVGCAAVFCGKVRLIDNIVF